MQGHAKLTKMLIMSLVCSLIKFTHTSQRAIPSDVPAVVNTSKSSPMLCPTTAEKREGKNGGAKLVAYKSMMKREMEN